MCLFKDLRRCHECQILDHEDPQLGFAVGKGKGIHVVNLSLTLGLRENI